MSVNKEYQIVNLMRVTLSIIFCLVILFMIMKFLWDSESDSVTRFSAFFTAISSLGILATIGVYLWQKNDNNKKQKEFDEKLIPLIKKKSQLILYTIKKIESLIEKEGGNKTLLINKDTLILTENTYLMKKNPFSEYLNSVNLNIYNDDDNEINNNKLKLSSGLYHYIRRLNDEFNYIVNSLNSYIVTNVNCKSGNNLISNVLYSNAATRNKNNLLNGIEILEAFIEDELKSM
ncbi:hypothetical protein [Morganella morganii]|uniref:hypothetical protein n=1 Tax=Morganella morganii TaxID=582 RepID=UPI0024C30278|nr:hypothetical protein [Morganella morganii]WHZ52280.1 hypothetical protein QLX58_10665 [Morganella morganii]